MNIQNTCEKVTKNLTKAVQQDILIDFDEVADALVLTL